MEPLVDAFGYTNVKVEGYEADDVIATLAERGQARGHRRDGRDRRPRRVPADRAGRERHGHGPRDHRDEDLRPRGRDRPLRDPARADPDFFGLKGDTSDNIPGVPGIGDKTAAQLLQQFGDLEAVLASIDEISGAKRKENLTDHADDARMSKKLATAMRDMDVDVDLDEVVAREPDRSRLREMFREFELRDPLRAAGGGARRGRGRPARARGRARGRRARCRRRAGSLTASWQRSPPAATRASIRTDRDGAAAERAREELAEEAAARGGRAEDGPGRRGRAGHAAGGLGQELVDVDGGRAARSSPPTPATRSSSGEAETLAAVALAGASARSWPTTGRRSPRPRTRRSRRRSSTTRWSPPT